MVYDLTTKTKTIDLPDNMRCILTSEALLIEVQSPDNQKDSGFDQGEVADVQVFEIPAVYRLKWLNEDCEISIIDKNNMPKTLHSTETVAYIDADSLDATSLKIRTRQEGDIFMPYGMSQTKTVKKFFIDRKIPQQKRDRIPLFFDKNNLILIIGYQVSEKYKVSSSTKKNYED